MATHELDSGGMPNEHFEFTMTFKRTLRQHLFIVMNVQYTKIIKTEILRQMQELQKHEFIVTFTPPWRVPIFWYQRKLVIYELFLILENYPL